MSPFLLSFYEQKTAQKATIMYNLNSITRKQSLFRAVNGGFGLRSAPQVKPNPTRRPDPEQIHYHAPLHTPKFFQHPNQGHGSSKIYRGVPRRTSIAVFSLSRPCSFSGLDSFSIKSGLSVGRSIVLLNKSFILCFPYPDPVVIW